MSNKIQMLPAGKGILGSKALGVGLGIITGNPMMAAGALAGDSPMGRALSIYNTASSLGGKAETPAPAPESTGGGAVGLAGRQAGVDAGAAPGLMGRQNALTRRYGLMQEDPAKALADGLSALQDPSIPDEVRGELAEPFLKVRYFGNGGRKLF